MMGGTLIYFVMCTSPTYLIKPVCTRPIDAHLILPNFIHSISSLFCGLDPIPISWTTIDGSLDTDENLGKMFNLTEITMPSGRNEVESKVLGCKAQGEEDVPKQLCKTAVCLTRVWLHLPVVQNKNQKIDRGTRDSKRAKEKLASQL